MKKDVNKPPTFLRVYNPNMIFAGSKPTLMLDNGFIEKIKSLSYNKKDLA